MNILAWILFGLIAGTVANLIDPHPSSGGILGSIVLGVIGAVVGGLVANMVFGVGVSGFNLESFVIAILGALLVLFAQRSLFRRTV